MADLIDYQFEYNGLQFGMGTDYSLAKIDGLEDLNARMGDAALPRGDGDIGGLHTASGKELVAEIYVKGQKGTQELRDKVQALHTAFQHRTDALPFFWREPGFTDERYLWARPIGRAQARNPRTAHQPNMLVRLKVADPRIYGDAQKNVNVALYDAGGGGMDFPEEEFGMEFTGDSSTSVIADNLGNARAYPLLRFYGPGTGTVTEVTLTNSTTGQTAVFSTTILSGQILSANMRRIVTADTGDDPYISLDGSSRYGDWNLPRDPFYLEAGQNELRFEVTGGTSTDALCVVTFRDTWL